ncbi:hypothetical protein [Nitrosospira lacus]|uniref:hypothetical protein n=1 Tax=Nitrosospira lacus TaxID=1288494 RepID=UPI0013747EBD|nr:hypothetical protein [Nitrosospira lacus]
MMMKRKHYFKDATALRYLEPLKQTVIVRAMDAVTAKGELLKANIAKMREARKGKF